MSPSRPARLVLTLLTGLLLLVAPAVVSASATASAATETAATSGCGCTEIGPYVDPLAEVDPWISATGESAATDPVYRLEVSGTASTSLTIRRVADGGVVTTIHTTHTNWGFSPDQHRFVTWRAAAPNIETALYDLGGSRPGTPVATRTESTGDARIGFSPAGGSFLLAWLSPTTPNQVGIRLVNTTSGRDTHFGLYSHHPGPGGSAFSVAGWGFSPGDDAFMYAHTNSATSSPRVHLVDLADQSRLEFSVGGTAWWRFSPCGSRFGVVDQATAGTMRTRLYETASGASVADRSDPVAAVELRATATEHVARIGGTDHVLGPNPGCPQNEAPTWPAGATLTASNIGRTSVTLTWPTAADDRAVTAYRVYRGTTLVDTLSGDARSLRVTGLDDDTAYTFRIDAGDTDDAWTAGPAAQVRTLAAVPTWPAPKWLVADDVTTTSATLRWSAASDPDGVTGYRVKVDGETLTTTDGETRSHTVTGLIPGASYTFKVEATNGVGRTTTDGPTTSATTDNFSRLDVPEVHGTVYVDTNTNGRRDPGESGVDRNGFGHPVIIDLTRTDGRDPGPDLGDQVQNVTGAYSVHNIPDGTYLVTLWNMSEQLRPYTQVTPGDLQPQLVEIVDGQGWSGVDFGVAPGNLPTTGTSGVTGTVFVDDDGDGVRDAGEPPLPNAGVACFARPSFHSCRDYRTRADDQGRYHVESRAAGTIGVSAERPQGWYLTRRVVPHVLGTHETATQDIGLIEGRSTLSGVVFRDDDADGVRDVGEPASGGGGTRVCVENSEYLYEACPFVEPDGSWRQDGVPVGDYKIRTIVLPNNWQATAGARTTVSVTVKGQDVAGVDMGVDGPDAAVAGRLFDDHDHDGVRDAGEPGLARATLCLDDASGGRCVLTSADLPRTPEVDETGLYEFGHLSGGTVHIELPDGYLASDPTALHVDLPADTTVTRDLGVDPPATPPNAPTDVVATARDGAVALSWTAPSDDGGSEITDYRVYHALDRHASTWTLVDDGESAATTATVGDLMNDRAYWFRVVAVNAVGAGQPTAPVSATPRAPVVPTGPTRLTATARADAVTLTWSAPEDDGGADVTDYVVEQATGSGGWTTVPDGTSTATAAVVRGLRAGTAYRFRVAAVNAAGTGAWSAEASVTVAKPALASAPRQLTATSTKVRLQLRWLAPATTGGVRVTDYVVQVQVGPRWRTVREGRSASPRALVSGLKPRTRYAVRVAAVTSAGLGAWTRPLKVRTKG